MNQSFCVLLEKVSRVYPRPGPGLWRHITYTVNPKKLETGLRPNSAGIPYALLLRSEAIGFPTFGLLQHNGTPRNKLWYVLRLLWLPTVLVDVT